MTKYAHSSTFISLVGDKSRKLSLGDRLLVWIKNNQQRRADREISRVHARFGIDHQWHLPMR